MVSTNRTGFVGRYINASDFDVFEIVEATKADAVLIVVQINRQLDLSAFNLIRDFCIGEIIL